MGFVEKSSIWVNYNELTATSLGIMVSKGNHPQMALIQVNYPDPLTPQEFPMHRASPAPGGCWSVASGRSTKASPPPWSLPRCLVLRAAKRGA